MYVVRTLTDLRGSLNVDDVPERTRASMELHSTTRTALRVRGVCYWRTTMMSALGGANGVMAVHEAIQADAAEVAETQYQNRWRRYVR